MKRLPIRPVISKKPWKNRFEYWNEATHRVEKCAGFKIDIYEPISRIRHRLTRHVDYKTAKALYDRWMKMAVLGEFDDLKEELTGGTTTLNDLFTKWQSEASKSTIQRTEPLSPSTIRRMKVEWST